METIHENEFENAGLRKRSLAKKDDRSLRDRSTSPSSQDKIESPMHQLQQELKMKFPEIFFTDEFCDRECGTTTCLVGGVTCDLDEIRAFNKEPFDLKFEDGKLCLTHTSGTLPERILKKSLSKNKIIIIGMWIMCFATMFTLKLVFGEKYNELMSKYST